MSNRLHQNIYQLRKQSGLSQAEVADAIDITRPTYANMESGKRDPRIGELRKLAAFYEINIEDIVPDLNPSHIPESTSSQVEEVAALIYEKDQNLGEIKIPQEDKETFKQVLLYVLERVGAKPNVGETVLYKLLYFIDFDYFEKYQEQLTGAKYIRNHYGPTPVSFAQIVTEMQEDGELDITSGKYFKYKQRKYMPRKRANLSKISAQKLEHINEVLTRLSDKSAYDLSELSHQDTPWRTTKDGQPIDYMSVFYRGRETSVRDHSNDEL